MKHLRLLSFLLGLLACAPLHAESPPPAPDAAAAEKSRLEIEQVVRGLKYQDGTITLSGGLARIALPADYRYLSPADTATVLARLWGNPAGGQNLGMIVPKDFDPLGESSWAVILQFADDGYVKDDDAAKINYTDLLKQMKEEVSEQNAQRIKEGYSPIELVGWAEPPRYDAATHKLYWAKELKFGQEKEHTLNYNIRMLGRRGVLVLNAVASISQLKEVEKATPVLLGMVDFQEGHRYANFNDDTDKVATYGLAALVAGGVAAKAGFFKMLWIGILAFKKVIILAFIALGSQIGKIWTWIRGRMAAPEPSAVPPEAPPSGPA